MSSSGTTTFTITRDDIIKAALRSLGVIAVGETPQNEDYTNCAFALNLILKSLAAQGYLLWCYVHTTVPLTSGTASYTIGPAGTTPDVTANRPIRIAYAYVRNPQNIDILLTQYSKSDYDDIPNKTAEGQPTTFYYDPTLDKGTLYTWPVIGESGYSVIVAVQRQVEDIAAGTSSTQNFDLPQEWFNPLRWLLAKHIAPEYVVDMPKLAMIKEYAEEAQNEIANFTREEASVQFTVDPMMNSNVF